MADQAPKQPRMRVVEAGVPPHMNALIPDFQSKSRLLVKKKGPAGAPSSGLIVDAMEITPRGLVVTVRGRRYTLAGGGGWAYIVEEPEEETPAKTT